jgi:alcohol dehydrogenase class IV
MDINNIQFLSLNDLKNNLENIPFDSPLLIISQNSVLRWNLSEWLHKFTVNHPRTRCIDNPRPNPTLRHLVEHLSSPILADGIVSIGGGSAIDLGKALSSLRHLVKPNVKDIHLAIRERNFSERLPHIAIPSTAGTGSEVTSWATIWDDDNHKKLSIDSPDIVPTQAWIIPELTYNAPLRLTISTGLDAVCHASESYWAKKTDSLSQNISIRALKIMTASLPHLCRNLSSKKSRQQMVDGSLLAGLAFSRTRTTACHSISYPITAQFGVDHGLAAALTLGQVAEFNSQQGGLNEYLKIFEPFNGVQSWLDYVSEPYAPLRLSTFGIKKKDIDEIVINASTAGRIDNNHVMLSSKNIKKILLALI